MTVLIASWSGSSYAHSQLLYVCSLAFSQLMQNKLGETALINAGAYGYEEMAELLLQQGALINYQTKVS